MDYLFSSVRGAREEQAPSATKQGRSGGGCKVVTHVRNICIYTSTCIYTGIDSFFLFVRGARKQAPPATKSRR